MDLSYKIVQDTLIECTEFGLKNLMDNPKFLRIAGYMISLFPHLFYKNLIHDSDLLYTQWEQKGINMLQMSCELNPSDKVSVILNKGVTTNLVNDDIIKLTQAELQSIFPGETSIELYFKDVLNRSM